MSQSVAIEVEDLHKTYRDGLIRRRSFQALKGVSFQVQRGEIFGLLGPNGAGKTTFIKILLGIVRKTDGQASLLGHPAGAQAGRRRVGYLPENLRVPRHLTARTAMEYYGHLSGLSSSIIRERRESLLELVGLAHRQKDSVKKYSKGMLQRLGLAQALLHEPDLLILDEPTDGLDPVARNQVRELLARIQEQGTTIFLNSHILQEVELICEKVAILSQGTLRFVGEVEEITSDTQNEALEMTVIGDESAIREALSNYKIEDWSAVGERGFRFSLELANQNEIDACVDILRRQQISIAGMNRRRLSLEDAFLKIIEPEKN